MAITGCHLPALTGCHLHQAAINNGYLQAANHQDHYVSLILENT